MFTTVSRRPLRLAVPVVGALALVLGGAAVSGAQETGPATLRIRGGTVTCDAGEGTTTVVFERAEDADDLTLDITEASAEIEPGDEAESSIVDLAFDPESLPPGTDDAEAKLRAPLGSTATVTVAYEASGDGISVPEEHEVQLVVTVSDVCTPATSTSTPPSTSTIAPTTTAPAAIVAETMPRSEPAATGALSAKFTG